MTSSKAESPSYADINMTPLIDVMLVLLIIFIITIPMQTHAVKIENPSGTHDTVERQPDPIGLSIDFDGTIAWNTIPVAHERLLADIRRAASNPVQPEVHLTVDRFARYEVVAQTLADLQRLGLKKIGFVNDR